MTWRDTGLGCNEGTERTNSSFGGNFCNATSDKKPPESALLRTVCDVQTESYILLISSEFSGEQV